ncbi:hypothetical protein BD769DRAFT_1427527 [Suillus cothurnatus]|nr:hypothetical protein BD769DRAFT_1427527 [Suillus cothurnatus]
MRTDTRTGSWYTLPVEAIASNLGEERVNQLIECASLIHLTDLSVWRLCIAQHLFLPVSSSSLLAFRHKDFHAYKWTSPISLDHQINDFVGRPPYDSESDETSMRYESACDRVWSSIYEILCCCGVFLLLWNILDPRKFLQCDLFKSSQSQPLVALCSYRFRLAQDVHLSTWFLAQLVACIDEWAPYWAR